jgi:hypothetical protein
MVAIPCFHSKLSLLGQRNIENVPIPTGTHLSERLLCVQSSNQIKCSGDENENSSL